MSDPRYSLFQCDLLLKKTSDQLFESCVTQLLLKKCVFYLCIANTADTTKPKCRNSSVQMSFMTKIELLNV